MRAILSVSGLIVVLMAASSIAVAVCGEVPFEGPSWKAEGEGARLGGGKRISQKVAIPATGYSFEIGGNSIVCEGGSGAAQIIGSAAKVVGGTAEETFFSGCKVLGAATGCGVYGYGGEEKLLPKGEAFIALEGELVWLGKTGQRTSAGERLMGALTFKGTKEVITTIKFKNEGGEGCPPELNERTISITGAQVASLDKETAKETYAELKVNEEFKTVVLDLFLASREVEKWNPAMAKYEVVTVGSPKAGAENASLDGFVRQETSEKKIGYING